MNIPTLLKQFPLSGSAVIPTGNVPTPYHIYNGFGLFIGGVCDLNEAKQLLATRRSAACTNYRQESTDGNLDL